MKHVLKIITILSDGHFHSGEEIGALFGVSRAAINKQIKTLRSIGIHLVSVPGRGYRMSQVFTCLNGEEILSYTDLIIPPTIHIIPIIDSTNQFLLDRINELTSGTVCLAEYQYKGRGRRGRRWFSPFGTNLYFSMYWRFSAGPAAIVGLSLVVGISVAKTLRALSGKDIKVKWPNDLYLAENKLAGILVEMVGRSGDDLHVVIGIGINLIMQVLDEKMLNQNWANLGNFDRNHLVGQLINQLVSTMGQFEKTGLAGFMNEWKALDNYIDRPVKLMIGDDIRYGRSRGINDQGALLLEQEGKIIPYLGGEISLRSNE